MNKTQVAEMLNLQNQINTKVHEDWRNQRFEWYRAVWVECAELLDHYGWKWWKKQTPDIKQVQLELIDIWHFGLSMVLESHSDTNSAADYVVNEFQNASTIQSIDADFKTLLEKFTGQVLVEKTFNFGLFLQLLNLAELDFAELYRTYVGKNVLNRFRQDNGYQDGSYQKTWKGREDNEWLQDILEELKQEECVNGVFSEVLYQRLVDTYSRL